MLKKLWMFGTVMTLALTVSADCLQTCQEEYEECLRMSHATGKEKICGQLLRDCKLECATNGE